MTKLDELIKSLPAAYSLKLPANWHVLYMVNDLRAIGRDDKERLFLVARDSVLHSWDCITPPLDERTIIAMIPVVISGGDSRIITWPHTEKIMALAAYVGWRNEDSDDLPHPNSY